VARTPVLSPARARRASLSKPRQEALMATNNEPENSVQDNTDPATDPQNDVSDVLEDQAPASVSTPAAISAAPVSVAAQPGNLAELSAQLREAAAEIAEITAQAGRLGIAIDAAKALREGTTPEALRSLVLQRAAEAADARDIIAAPHSPILPKSTESPIVAAAKRAAAAGARG
jgi:hypothetical protein